VTPLDAERLYQEVMNFRPWVLSQCGQEADDVLHEAFLAVWRMSRRQLIEHPIGYIKGVIRFMLCQYIRTLCGKRRGVELDDRYPPPLHVKPVTPEQLHAKAECRALAMRTLDTLCARDREILTRFYFEEQSCGQVQKEMHLTETQYRLMKSRAKNKTAERFRKLSLQRRFAKAA